MLGLAAVSLACAGADTPATARPNNASADTASRAVRATPVGEPPAVDAGPRSTMDSAEQARVDSVLAAIAACPRDGRWHPCSLERRLQLAGLRPVRLDSVTGDDARIPGLDAPTVVWRTGARTLRAAFFPDSAAARAAFATLDSVGAAPRGGPMPAWSAPPTLFRGANAILVFLGGTSRQVERVTDAVLAGPPQPQ